MMTHQALLKFSMLHIIIVTVVINLAIASNVQSTRILIIPCHHVWRPKYDWRCHSTPTPSPAFDLPVELEYVLPVVAQLIRSNKSSTEISCKYGVVVVVEKCRRKNETRCAKKWDRRSPRVWYLEKYSYRASSHNDVSHDSHKAVIWRNVLIFSIVLTSQLWFSVGSVLFVNVVVISCIW